MDIIKIDDYYFYEEEEVPNEMILTGYNLSQELEYLEKMGLNRISQYFVKNLTII